MVNSLAMYEDTSRLVRVIFPVSFTSNVEVRDKYLPIILNSATIKQNKEKSSPQKTGENNLAFQDNHSFRKWLQCWQNFTCSQVMSMAALEVSPVSPAQISLLIESSGHLHGVVGSSFLENWPPR